MAIPATKMMFFKNGKPLPLHLLRGSLLGGYTTTTSTIQFLSDPTPLQPEQRPVFSLLGDQSNVGLGGGINGVLNWRSGGFGEMDPVYARGERKTVISDEDEDEDDNEYDDEEIEDFDEDDEDDSDDDDDIDIDARKKV